MHIFDNYSELAHFSLVFALFPPPYFLSAEAGVCGGAGEDFQGRSHVVLFIQGVECPYNSRTFFTSVTCMFFNNC